LVTNHNSVNFQDLKWGLNVMFEVRLDDGMMTDHQARTLVHALDHDGSGGKSKEVIGKFIAHAPSQVVFVVLVSVCLFL